MKEEDARLLYSVSVNDIHNFKEQQWKVTNYVLLILTAIFSLSNLIENVSCIERTLLGVITIVLVVVGCYFTKRLHLSISFRQDRLSILRDFLGQEFKNAWAAGKSDFEIVASKKDVLWLFCSAQIVFGLVVFWLLVMPLVIA